MVAAFTVDNLFVAARLRAAFNDKSGGISPPRKFCTRPANESNF